jgi:hypothetical protein
MQCIVTQDHMTIRLGEAMMMKGQVKKPTKSTKEWIDTLLHYVYGCSYGRSTSPSWLPNLHLPPSQIDLAASIGTACR